MNVAPCRPIYLDHFGLQHAPFLLTPNTDFFFGGGQRGETLDALLYSLVHSESVIVLTGEVGCGKTMLSRMLIENKPAQFEIVFIAKPTLDRDEIILEIARELRMRIKDMSTLQVMRSLQRRLLRLHGQGKRVIVLIDEAHAMPPGTLEEVRLLSNLETGHHKLMQILLVGQPELDDVLATREMRPLRERITDHFRLEPLTAGDIAGYLEFRLQRAGARQALFEARAAALLAKASQGLARRINILAEKSLLAAFAEGAAQVEISHVRQAIIEVRPIALHRWSPMKFTRRWSNGWGLAWITALIGGFLASSAARAFWLR